MKTSILHRTIASFALLSVLSCQKELDQPLPVENISVQFEVDQFHVHENSGERAIRLALNKPANRAGLISIMLDTLSERFKINTPLQGRKMEIAIEKGQQNLEFKLLPSDNQLVDGEISINFNIASISSGYTMGTKKKLHIVIIDDDFKIEPKKTSISFATATARISENRNEGQAIPIQFSNPVEGSGSFEISIHSEKAKYGLDYITEPAAQSGRILNTPAVGATSIIIKIIPINNSMIHGDLSIDLTIDSTDGTITKGDQDLHTLIIEDDELSKLPKGYSTDGALGQTRIFEYNEYGLISKVITQTSKTIHTESYLYDANGKIERISTGPDFNRIFIWNSNRITRSERIELGILKEYIEYDYDEQGNVIGTANYFRQPNGEYKLSFVVAYLYFSDNNLYKSMYYLPSEKTGGFTLHSTRTYENYLDKENPFPMVDILPGKKAQTKLPGTFRLEENGYDLHYTIEYEFNSEGRISRRYARNGSQVEKTDYFYY